MQYAKKSPKIAIWAPSHNFVGLYLRNEGTYRQSEKNLLSSDMSSAGPHSMVNFGLLTAEMDLVKNVLKPQKNAAQNHVFTSVGLIHCP